MRIFLNYFYKTESKLFEKNFLILNISFFKVFFINIFLITFKRFLRMKSHPPSYYGSKLAPSFNDSHTPNPDHLAQEDEFKPMDEGSTAATSKRTSIVDSRKLSMIENKDGNVELIFEDDEPMIFTIFEAANFDGVHHLSSKSRITRLEIYINLYLDNKEATISQILKNFCLLEKKVKIFFKLIQKKPL